MSKVRLETTVPVKSADILFIGDLLPKPLKRPSNDTALEDADVLRLTFRREIADPNKHDIFYPKSTFSSGRNALLRLALGLEKGKGF